MDALILAAGHGTRLRPVTDRCPKALVEVGGKTLLRRVAERLVAAGADRLVVNVHGFPDLVRAEVARRRGFGTDVRLSYEEDGPLETGGGLLHAAPHLRLDAPFFAHNVDVLTDLDLGALYADHLRSGARATVAVMDRPSARGLLFDDAGLLGRVDDERALRTEAREREGEVVRLAFAGVHVISPDFLDEVSERGAFSILDPYTRLAARPGTVRAHRVDGCRWIDVGRLSDLERARRELA